MSERAELERRVREFAAGLEKHAAEIISGDHEESDREVATTYRVVAYDLKALLSQEQPSEVFASRSQEKRIRTMRGDPDPLTLREAQPVADAPSAIRAKVLREAADSIRRRAACWAGEGQAGATQASIDIRAELLNEALTVEKLTPELSDKNGWVYDPDAKLAEIRAGMAAPEPDKTCSVCGNEEVHHRTGMLTCECPALKRFSDETDRLRAGASQPPAPSADCAARSPLDNMPCVKRQGHDGCHLSADRAIWYDAPAQPPAETKMEPEPRPSFHRYVGREDLCKACKEPFDTGNHFDDRRGERRRQPPVGVSDTEEELRLKFAKECERFHNEGNKCATCRRIEIGPADGLRDRLAKAILAQMHDEIEEYKIADAIMPIVLGARVSQAAPTPQQIAIAYWTATEEGVPRDLWKRMAELLAAAPPAGEGSAPK